MSNWEERLRNLAEGAPWEWQSTTQVKASLEQLQKILGNVSSETGLTGSTDLAASAVLARAKKGTENIIEYLDGLPQVIEKANAARDTAQKALSQLGAGSLSPEQTNMIRAAEAGATVVVGPVAVVVGEGAIAMANAFFGNKREEEAKSAVQAVSTQIDEARRELKAPPSFQDGDPDADTPPTKTQAPTINGGGSPSFPQYPDHDAPAGNGGHGYVLVGTDGTVIDNGHPTDIVIPRDPEDLPVIIPTPDGPITGGVTYPGAGGGNGGGGGGGLLGGGGGVGSGLIAGAGGAAALGGLSRLSGGGGGISALARMAGIGGVGAPGAGGIGGAGVRGAAGGLSANNGTGGLLGRGGAGGAGGVGAAGAAEGAAGRGGMGMAGGAGGAGGQGAGRGGKQRGRGLGGPMAPRLEDDEELGPLSENAGAGGRE